MSSISLIQPDRDLFSWPQYWAACFGPAPFLPMSREEMDQLGWDSCDIILVTGDAYVDHPSFGMAICGRMLEAQGFRVGIIAQPDWSSKDDFMRLGKPNLFFGVTAGNMDSMINRYTADRRLRHDDAYTPDNVAGKRPDRATLVYTQRCKEAWKDVPVILGGIEASLRRTAHYDYWSDTVRRSVLVDSKADMLMFGNGERPLVEVAHRLAMGEPISEIRDVRNTAIIVKEAASGAHERQVFDNLCKSLQAGDTLVVCKMDRFCRSAKEGLQYVDLLRDKGVAVHILNMGLLDNSPMGRLVATMLLAFAEFERAQIIERTQSGRQAAMAKPGFRDGRPQKFTALQVEHALGLLLPVTVRLPSIHGSAH